MNLRTLPPSPRPTLVDSLSSLVTLLDTIKDPYYAAEIRQTWLEWGPIVLPVVPDIKQAGIDYHIVSPEEEPIACEPGSNRYSIFDDYKTPEYMNEILQAFAPDVAAPRQLSARNYIQSDFDLPFVFKDTESNRGENKFLIESETQARKLKRFLGRLVGGGLRCQRFIARGIYRDSWRSVDQLSLYYDPDWQHCCRNAAGSG